MLWHTEVAQRNKDKMGNNISPRGTLGDLIYFHYIENLVGQATIDLANVDRHNTGTVWRIIIMFIIIIIFGHIYTWKYKRGKKDFI